MSEEQDDLPYRAEYAKSGRSSCKACKEPIAKASLRLAMMIQSPMFDGKMANWFHPPCLFGRSRPKAIGDFAHYDSLRWEDQEKIKKLIEGGAGAAVAGKGKKGSKTAEAAVSNGTDMKDFRTEYAKSGGSKCGACEDKIPKGHVRIGKKEYDSTRAKMYGPYDRWHHVKCFVEKREELEFFASGEELAGFNTLSADDKEMLRSELKTIAQKKRKAEEAARVDEPDTKKSKVDEKEIKQQNIKMFYYRDLLQKNLHSTELKDLLESNGQELPPGVERILDRLADIMTFGALKPCPECKTGQFVYRSGVGYQCQGNVTEWTKCTNTVEKPERKPFIVPQEYREKYDFLKLYKYKPRDRLIQKNQSTVKPKGSDYPDGKNGSGASKMASGKHPLRGLSFVLDEDVDKNSLKSKIEALGGKVSKDINAKTAALITTKKTLEKKSASKAIKAAMKHKIQAVSEDVLDEVTKEGIISCIRAKTIGEWEATDPKKRITFEEANGSKSDVKKDVPKSMKMKLKGGGYVDPDSHLEDKAHVLKIKDTFYSAVLGAVDIASGKNSFYKIQVLEHDKKPKWWVFRSWGRVGTTIGGNTLDSFHERNEAVEMFEFQYEQKSGNHWAKRKDFKKVAGKMYPMDLDFGQGSAEIAKINVAESRSKLDKPIQELISLIFDIEQMKKTMVEFEIDTEKMPLGKLSRKQIESAYKILTEALDMIRNETGSPVKFIDATNRFFTLIPHDFGLNSPPILDNPDYIKTKIDMLDNLLEIEVAYNLLSSSTDESGIDPIDAHYAKLNCGIEVLDKDSEEFKIIEKYTKNTHAATHNLFSLELEHVFKIDRPTEKTRFKVFERSKMDRMLLWHGSRTTNFAGIISQGLKIAPPEAPVTGYMFGKGIYFADMVSKSANYCQTTRTNNTGLLMLCDVAVGKMYERYHADYIEKLPAGMQSTKGVGKTEPDPKEFTTLDGAKVPYGKGVKAKQFENNKSLRSDLLYNEYIVYDVAQVKSKYLLRVKFNYKI